MFASGSISSLGDRFINRGDLDAVDFAVGDFTKDEAWHDLDLSGIIPVTCKLVMLRLVCNASVIGRAVLLKTKGDTGEKNIDEHYVSVINQPFGFTGFIIPDANRKIEYFMSTTGWVTLNLTISGWWV